MRSERRLIGLVINGAGEFKWLDIWTWKSFLTSIVHEGSVSKRKLTDSPEWQSPHFRFD